ncbi:relaxase/mobilization nuclease domain-containing protein [Parvularcula sp. LCG005]|uniref:relaxase/mobilization nuclease domain-containing protein n=1 Tax=Parvularcula sp. LCG005 TaxID=3078805 RepID=UPI00294259A2|nr:relaxase/mobilization nuclease domain-containing protein [Parvularcula sp. LCG005]WOI52978.1 relaxase/mobilization nuclease domain-containing protein [Parvularcula sp. LCG005]
MILVGNQRGGAQNLALHLLSPENEHVYVHEISGFASDTLQGAFNEAYAISRGTRCQQFLFSLSLNPPEDAEVSEEEFYSAISKVEEKLGLIGQPRAIVFHEKEGRRHCHAVWSRIDSQAMKAIPLSFSKSKMQEVSRELYLEHGWKMPRGLAQHGQSDPRNFTLAEWQQARRMGRNARDLKDTLQDAWAISDSRAGFEAALQERGFKLARGDRRGFVAVPYDGEVLSLSRYLGVTKKDMESRLGSPKELPSVDETKRQMAQEMTPVMRGYLRQADEQHQRLMEPHLRKKAEMTHRHRKERVTLDQKLNTQAELDARVRAARLSKGWRGLWQRVSGKRDKIIAENLREAEAAKQRDSQERHALMKNQLQQRRMLQEPIKWERQRHTKEKTEIHRELARYRQEGRDPPSREQVLKQEVRLQTDAFTERTDRKAEFRARRREPKRDGPSRHRPRGPSLSR